MGTLFDSSSKDPPRKRSAARRCSSTQGPNRAIRSKEFNHAMQGLVDPTAGNGMNAEIEAFNMKQT